MGIVTSRLTRDKMRRVIYKPESLENGVLDDIINEVLEEFGLAPFEFFLKGRQREKAYARGMFFELADTLTNYSPSTIIRYFNYKRRLHGEEGYFLKSCDYLAALKRTKGLVEYDEEFYYYYKRVKTRCEEKINS